MSTKSLWRRFQQSFLLVALLFAGCDNPQRTVDELKQDLASYRAKATDDGKIRIEVGFEKLDQQIAKLNQKGESLKADVLQGQRDDLATEYTTAQLGKVVNDATEAFKGFGKAFEKAGRDIKQAIQDQNQAASNAP